MGDKTAGYRRYRATRRIETSRVSGAARLVVEEGEVVETDGTSVRLPGGRLANSASIAAAIAVGWLVPAEP